MGKLRDVLRVGALGLVLGGAAISGIGPNAPATAAAAGQAVGGVEA